MIESKDTMSDDPGAEPSAPATGTSSDNREYEEIKRRAKNMTFRAREFGGAALEKTNPIGWAKRFLSFDELIGLQLTVALYYIGMLLIVVTLIYTMIQALGSITENFLGVLGVWTIGPLSAIVMLMLLRLLCERMYIYFKDRVGTPGSTTDNMVEDMFMGEDD